MAFLNEKEDVIEIQLTQLGKHLLSEGRFSPYYYSFYDNTIMYDSKYAHVSESQNDVQDRIRELPQLNAQYVYAGIETNVTRNNKLIRANILDPFSDLIQPENDRIFSMPEALGNSSLGSEYIPSWNIKFLDGDISGSIDYITGSHQILRIPQITSKLTYTTTIRYTDVLEDEDLDLNNPRPSIEEEEKVYEDGSYIDIEKEKILIEILEENTPFSNENFNIEVFRIEDENYGKIEESGISKKERLIPMYFVNRENNVDTSFTLGENIEDTLLELDPTFVEYFFDIFVDSEIDKRDLCKTLKRCNKTKDLFADRMLDCEEVKEGKIEDIYMDPDFDKFEDCD